MQTQANLHAASPCDTHQQPALRTVTDMNTTTPPFRAVEQCTPQRELWPHIAAHDLDAMQLADALQARGQRRHARERDRAVPLGCAGALVSRFCARRSPRGVQMSAQRCTPSKDAQKMPYSCMRCLTIGGGPCLRTMHGNMLASQMPVRAWSP
jgi:hypothetical protein